MSLKQNFKQSLQIIRQNKLFSGIYIAGTAIAISMVMVIAIVWMAKTADIYPEFNRSKTMTIKGLARNSKEDKSMWSSRPSNKFVTDILNKTTTYESIAEVIVPFSNYECVFPGEKKYSAHVMFTNYQFYKVFEFSFLAGMPYSEEEVNSAIAKAVISESIAKRFYDSPEKAINQRVVIDFIEYSICGVVKDVSQVMTSSFAELWLPISRSTNYYNDSDDGTGFLGSELLYIKMHSSKDFKKFKAEVDEKIAAYNSASDYTLDLFGQPEPYAKSILREYSNNIPDISGYILKLSLVILLILIVPAINLAGMISSKMTRRMEELGIRKTFGATKWSILSQIINENLLLTLIGGLFGLLLSYLILAIGGNAIINLIVPAQSDLNGDTFFTLSMLMNPWIFVIAFAICLILNMLASIIPAIHSLRNNIVDSLNVKK